MFHYIYYTLLLLSAACVAACTQTTSTPFSSESQFTRPPTQDLSPVQSVSPVISLSTPELIDAALDRGEISRYQRLLYLDYAVYDYDLLPEAYRSQKRWDGTMVVSLRAAVSPEVICNMLRDAHRFPTVAGW
jgi:hypothetical protein